MSLSDVPSSQYAETRGRYPKESSRPPALNGKIHDAAVAAARVSAWLAPRSDQFAELLLSSARLKKFRKNSVIVAAQEEGEGLHFLLKGSVQVAMPSLLEEMCVVHFLSPHEWFGALSAATVTRSPAEFRARTHCLVLTIDRSTIARVLRNTPSSILPILELIVQSAQRLAEIVAETTGLKPVGRVLAKLLSLSTQAIESGGSGSCCLPISQAELGKICCVSRTTVNRVLLELEAEGILNVSYAQITVLKRDELLTHFKKVRA